MSGLTRFFMKRKTSILAHVKPSSLRRDLVNPKQNDCRLSAVVHSKGELKICFVMLRGLGRLHVSSWR